MSVQELRQIREANPFLPFEIRMADGRSHWIQHRDYLTVHPVGRIATVYLNNGACSIIVVMLITELTIDAPSASTEQTKLPPHQHN